MALRELLIVAGMTLLLAAILFPGLSRVREYGRRSSCQSNLKQIGVAFQQYAQDYNKKFPTRTGGNAPVVSTTGGVWILLQPYLKNEQFLQCPSEKHPPEGPNSSAYTDYQYNLLLGYDQKTSAERGLPLSALTQPALTVIANDGATGYPDAATPGCAGWPNPTFTCAAGKAAYTNSPIGPCQRHASTQNFLFTDGHVKACKSQSASQSAEVYNYATPGSTSGRSPTYNTAP